MRFAPILKRVRRIDLTPCERYGKPVPARKTSGRSESGKNGRHSCRERLGHAHGVMIPMPESEFASLFGKLMIIDSVAVPALWPFSSLGNPNDPTFDLILSLSIAAESFTG